MQFIDQTSTTPHHGVPQVFSVPKKFHNDFINEDGIQGHEEAQ
jgi:hypothetical protein